MIDLLIYLLLVIDKKEIDLPEVKIETTSESDKADDHLNSAIEHYIDDDLCNNNTSNTNNLSSTTTATNKSSSNNVDQSPSPDAMISDSSPMTIEVNKRNNSLTHEEIIYRNNLTKKKFFENFNLNYSLLKTGAKPENVRKNELVSGQQGRVVD